MNYDCLFCKIANKDADALVLYEDEVCIVILDAFPDTDGHSLVIPKKHYETIYDMDNETLLHINEVAKKYGKIIMNKLDKNAITFLVNYGEAQVIKHFHLHIIPNFKEKPTMSREEVYERIMK